MTILNLFMRGLLESTLPVSSPLLFSFSPAPNSSCVVLDFAASFLADVGDTLGFLKCEVPFDEGIVQIAFDIYNPQITLHVLFNACVKLICKCCIYIPRSSIWLL
jgi:hypothetical protein